MTKLMLIVTLLLGIGFSVLSFMSVQAGLWRDQSTEIAFLRATLTEQGDWYVLLDVDRRLEIRMLAEANPPIWIADGLVFEMYIDGHMDVMLQTRAGDLINLTGNPANDDRPNVSPDGTMIAFRSERTGSSELFLMDADGGNIQQLTDASGLITYSLWSPDSQRIAYFVASGGSGRFYVVELRSNEAHQLIATSLSGCNNYQWSPDSRYLLCEMRASEDIFRIDLETGGTLNLTNHPANDVQAQWSPDGTMIAFMSDRAANQEIYVMDADGGNPRNLTNTAQPEGYPRWSPDGSRILFSGGATSQTHFYVVDVATGERINLTEQLYEDYPGSIIYNNLGRGGFWSLDGERVLLRVANGSGRQFFMVNADGTNLHPVTRMNSLFGDGEPQWRP